METAPQQEHILIHTTVDNSLHVTGLTLDHARLGTSAASMGLSLELLGLPRPMMITTSLWSRARQLSWEIKALFSTLPIKVVSHAQTSSLPEAWSVVGKALNSRYVQRLEPHAHWLLANHKQRGVSYMLLFATAGWMRITGVGVGWHYAAVERNVLASVVEP